MNEQVKVTRRILCTIEHSLTVHVIVLEVYIHFALMYTSYHILIVLPIKYPINKDGKLTTPFKLAPGKKPLVSHLFVLFCPCFVWKATVHVETKILSMSHQAQTCLCGIFVGVTQHQKGYLVCVPHKRNVIS